LRCHNTVPRTTTKTKTGRGAGARWKTATNVCSQQDTQDRIGTRWATMDKIDAKTMITYLGLAVAATLTTLYLLTGVVV